MLILLPTLQIRDPGKKRRPQEPDSRKINALRAMDRQRGQAEVVEYGGGGE